jgi:3-methyladenine DNA glycosylase AlkD
VSEARRENHGERSAHTIRAELESLANPAYAKVVARYFKTGPGDYAEGDEFIGLSTPQLRAIGKTYRDAPFAAVKSLLGSPKHEIRLAALLILVYKFEVGDDRAREACFEFYLDSLDRVNNWDLVDVSAAAIVGTWLLDKDRAPLFELAGSENLWRRRVAIVSCLAIVHAGESTGPLSIAEILLDDPHDLIHKAVGWVLRDTGKHVSRSALDQFLSRHAQRMPTTMMRYAVEHYPAQDRKTWLARAKRSRRA